MTVLFLWSYYQHMKQFQCTSNIGLISQCLPKELGQIETYTKMGLYLEMSQGPSGLSVVFW